MSLAGKLQRFLDKQGVFYQEGKSSFITTCFNPSCGKEDHCYIRKTDGQSICFKCGHKWNWRRLVAAIARCRVKDAYEILFGTGAGDELHQELELHFEVEEEEEVPEPEIKFGPDFVPVTQSERGMQYLVKRGVYNAELILAYDLRYHAAMDAVVFPITKEQKLYGWQARRIDPEPGGLRMISHTFAKAKFLLNWDGAKAFKKVVLVEGPFDCLKVDLREHGISAVASLGKGVSNDQIKLILDLPAKDIYLGLDPDAFLEVYDVVNRIGLGKRIFRVRPPENRKDFGECVQEETVDAVLKRAQLVSGPSDMLELFFK